MSENPEQAVSQIETDDDVDNYINDSLIEQIWYDLKGQVNHSQIYQVALQEAVEFRNVAVKNFISVFIRRRTCKKLKAMLKGEDSVAH